MSEPTPVTQSRPPNLAELAEWIIDIQRFTAGLRREDLLINTQAYHATLMQLVFIGEFITRIPEDNKQRFHDVAWLQLLALKHQLMNSRYDPDDRVIWDTVQCELPPLQRTVEKMLDEQRNPDN